MFADFEDLVQFRPPLGHAQVLKQRSGDSSCEGVVFKGQCISCPTQNDVEIP